MVFDPGHFWVIFLNIAVILLIHLGISWGCSNIPLERFDPWRGIYRIKEFEKKGALYRDFFKIKKWKDFLPDGAKLFKRGFPKKKLENKSQVYLRSFVLETCRAEFTHWLQIAPVPVFLLWNVWWGGVIMIAYFLIANIPCILLQRYNRARLLQVLS